MTTIKKLHHEAMALAGQGLLARRRGDRESASSLLESALDLESRAAMLSVEQDAGEPTRSVLLRSAASLAWQCQRLGEAEQFINLGLSADPPEEIAEELRDLLAQVKQSELDASATATSEACSSGH